MGKENKDGTLLHADMTDGRTKAIFIKKKCKKIDQQRIQLSTYFNLFHSRTCIPSPA